MFETKIQAREEKETGRIEAFSDGVFAIALTLLILDIKVPSRDLPAGVNLLTALTRQWPSYFAFILGFATIAIMWINHHRLFSLIKRSNDPLMILNCLLLFIITFVPFPTALLSEYLGQPDERTAVLVYCGTSIVIAICFNLLWRYAAYKNRLLDRNSDPASIAAISRSYLFGPLVYSIAFVLVFVSVALSLLLAFGLAIFFALPLRFHAPQPSDE
jgi:uncharacterized membrane protein